MQHNFLQINFHLHYIYMISQFTKCMISHFTKRVKNRAYVKTFYSTSGNSAFSCHTGWHYGKTRYCCEKIAFLLPRCLNNLRRQSTDAWWSRACAVRYCIHYTWYDLPSLWWLEQVLDWMTIRSSQMNHHVCVFVLKRTWTGHFRMFRTLMYILFGLMVTWHHQVMSGLLFWVNYTWGRAREVPFPAF